MHAFGKAGWAGDRLGRLGNVDRFGLGLRFLLVRLGVAGRLGNGRARGDKCSEEKEREATQTEK